ncbi:hypothetical protein [Tsukamurella paurometabola]|uniref:Uncharacterized protein n=1 Tax=Tsukamurella paurometabola TaxID=2061 RepID=A0ABS5NEU3_TSUPA|nr:hypothetical protein [Tsukamurella paurometabola]MBS4102789.1 hypothetical protein [Tsukamurella paurometabola]
MHRTLSPLIDQAQGLDAADLSTAPVVQFVEMVRAARVAIHDLCEEETPDDIVDEMTTTLKVLIMTALRGHLGVIDTIDAVWRPRLVGYAKGERTTAPYVDIFTGQATSEPSYSSIPFPVALTSIDPGAGDIRQPTDPDDKTRLQAQFAAMWLTLWVAKWEKSYRPRLADAHGCTLDDILSPLIGDMVKMRDAVAHRDGVATKAVENATRLKWYREREVMQPTEANYRQLLQEFEVERTVLVSPPSASQSERVQVKGKVTRSRRAEYEELVADLGLKPDAALDQAIGDWVAARRKAAPT